MSSDSQVRIAVRSEIPFTIDSNFIFNASIRSRAPYYRYQIIYIFNVTAMALNMKLETFMDGISERTAIRTLP